MPSASVDATKCMLVVEVIFVTAFCAAAVTPGPPKGKLRMLMATPRVLSVISVTAVAQAAWFLAHPAPHSKGNSVGHLPQAPGPTPLNPGAATGSKRPAPNSMHGPQPGVVPTPRP